MIKCSRLLALGFVSRLVLRAKHDRQFNRWLGRVGVLAGETLLTYSIVRNAELGISFVSCADPLFCLSVAATVS